MSYPCVVLCSERLEGGTEQQKAERAALAAQMQTVFGIFDMPQIEGFEIWDAIQDGLDGGNGGGGGDTGPAAPIFIRGHDNVGVWNFRKCRPDVVKTSASRLVSFPVAARIELCIHFATVTAAREALSDAGRGPLLSYLRKIFTNIILVPVSLHVPPDAEQINSTGGDMGASQ